MNAESGQTAQALLPAAKPVSFLPAISRAKDLLQQRIRRAPTIPQWMPSRFRIRSKHLLE
jgi:hypothetical protein